MNELQVKKIAKIRKQYVKGKINYAEVLSELERLKLIPEQKKHVLQDILNARLELFKPE